MPDDVLQNVTENVNETKIKQEGDESCIDVTLHHVEEDMPRFAEEPTHLYTALIDLMKQGSVSPFIGTLPVPETIMRKGGGRVW